MQFQPLLWMSHGCCKHCFKENKRNRINTIYRHLSTFTGEELVLMRQGRVNRMRAVAVDPDELAL